MILLSEPTSFLSHSGGFLLAVRSLSSNEKNLDEIEVLDRCVMISKVSEFSELLNPMKLDSKSSI